MSDARWIRVRALLEGALEQPESDREAWVRAQAEGDDAPDVASVTCWALWPAC